MATPERKYLKELTTTVSQFLVAIDRVMQAEESGKRGKSIAHLCNALQLANDRAKRFGLGLDFNGKPLKRNKVGGF